MAKVTINGDAGPFLNWAALHDGSKVTIVKKVIGKAEHKETRNRFVKQHVLEVTGVPGAALDQWASIHPACTIGDAKKAAKKKAAKTEDPATDPIVVDDDNAEEE